MDAASVARLKSLGLVAPGIVVNTLKGDANERRASGWLEWDGELDGLKAALVGIPFDGASVVRTGARGGPDAVRRGMMWHTIYSSSDCRSIDSFRAADIGDVFVNLTDMARTFGRITDIVSALVAHGIVPILVGGDHSISYPCMRGMVRAIGEHKRLGIVHFDAHHDLREAHLGAESSGVPFRKALETLSQSVLGRNLVQIGIAEFANPPQLAAFARACGVTVIPGRGLRHDSMRKAVERALECASDGTDAIYVSVDIDCIDQAQAQGTAAPNPFGLDLRDVQDALRLIGTHPKIAGFDLVEISPSFDHDDMTGRAGASLVLSFLYWLASRSGS